MIKQLIFYYSLFQIISKYTKDELVDVKRFIVESLISLKLTIQTLSVLKKSY